jgi:hypothetical protein
MDDLILVRTFCTRSRRPASQAARAAEQGRTCRSAARRLPLRSRRRRFQPAGRRDTRRSPGPPLIQTSSGAPMLWHMAGCHGPGVVASGGELGFRGWLNGDGDRSSYGEPFGTARVVAHRSHRSIGPHCAAMMGSVNAVHGDATVAATPQTAVRLSPRQACLVNTLTGVPGFCRSAPAVVRPCRLGLARGRSSLQGQELGSGGPGAAGRSRPWPGD